MEVATWWTDSQVDSEVLQEVSTPFLPNGSRYMKKVYPFKGVIVSKFQHLFFLMEVAT